MICVIYVILVLKYSTKTQYCSVTSKNKTDCYFFIGRVSVDIDVSIKETDAVKLIIHNLLR